MIDYANLPTVEIPAPIGRDPLATSRWRRSSREKKRSFANQEVARAKRRGLIAVGPCAACGATERIEAHHPDYDSPRMIVWLCQWHHKQLHASDPVYISKLRAGTRRYLFKKKRFARLFKAGKIEEAFAWI